MADMPANCIPAAFIALFIGYAIVVLGGYRYLKITFNRLHISFSVCQLVLLGCLVGGTVFSLSGARLI
jgi:hypothetical protein